MQTQEINAGDWRSFFDEFSRRHGGKSMSVETAGCEIGFHANVRGLPLMGVTAERRNGGGWWLEIAAGDSPGAYMSHTIERPTRVRTVEWDGGQCAAVHVEAAGEYATLIRVGPPDAILPHGFVARDAKRRNGTRRTASRT